MRTSTLEGLIAVAEKNHTGIHIDASSYSYEDAESNSSHEYLLPELTRLLDVHLSGSSRRVFEVGSGNGFIANRLAQLGYHMTGIELSPQGVAQANTQYPDIAIHSGSVYDDLHATYGLFPTVVSLEVVEHLYDPRAFARTCFDLLEPEGVLILSTPYHGYWKNLALAATGHLDHHFTALWDHGHIKFWSFRTLRELLMEVGFTDIRFTRVGRVPIIAKSMFAVATKPVA